MISHKSTIYSNFEEFPILYKMDSKGKIRQWQIFCADHGTYSEYEQEHGLVDGKLQTTSTVFNTGKNIGKANETTHWEQCLSEAQSLWTKKKNREGYSETIPSERPCLPMLAKVYKDHKKKVKYPCYVDGKLDGLRCIAKTKIVNGQIESITLLSRKGKEFTSIAHIKDAIIEALDADLLNDGEIILDGELYNHDLKDDFQGIISAVKRDKPSSNSENIQYYVYDIFSDDDFTSRADWLDLFLTENAHIKRVERKIVLNEYELHQEYIRLLGLGYEGAMVRNQMGSYEPNRRSHNLLKMKTFDDAEFEIVGAYENKGKMVGQCTFECITKDGAKFGVKPKGTEEQRKEMWQRWLNGELKGKFMTVRYFGMTTSDPPVPRFPIGTAIRDYE